MKVLTTEMTTLYAQELATDTSAFVQKAALQQILSAADMLADMMSDEDTQVVITADAIRQHAINMLTEDQGTNDHRNYYISMMINRLNKTAFDVGYTLSRTLSGDKFIRKCAIVVYIM